MSARYPLPVLLDVRGAIKEAIEATEAFGYEDFNKRMQALEAEARELFRMFDRYYSDLD